MDNLDIVAILGTGATGFSFLMLFVGYKLTSDIQNRILDTNLLGLSPDRLKTWEKIAGKQINNTRVFLIFTLAFLIAGLAMLAYRPEIKVILRLTPMETKNPPVVYVQEKQVLLDENGIGMVVVRDEHALNIDNTTVLKALAKLTVQHSASAASESSLAQKLADKSPDSGFGNFFSGE